jgi:hypothetical protein
VIAPFSWCINAVSLVVLHPVSIDHGRSPGLSQRSTDLSLGAVCCDVWYLTVCFMASVVRAG